MYRWARENHTNDAWLWMKLGGFIYRWSIIHNRIGIDGTISNIMWVGVREDWSKPYTKNDTNGQQKDGIKLNQKSQ